MENNNIQKPFSVIVNEAKEGIVASINAAQLHPTLLEMILKEILFEVQTQARTALEQETLEYNRSLSKAKTEGSEVIAGDVVNA